MPQKSYSAGLHRRGTASAVILLLCAALLIGCAGLGGAGQGEQSEPQREATRQALNEGYSLLYSAVSSLSNTDKAFYVKVESDSVQQVIGNVSDYAGELQADLERIAQDFPAVKIDLDPLPEIEKRKRASISEDTLKSLAPVVGKTGPAFERKLLLSASGALNQLEFLCQVMAEDEPVDSLRQVLVQAQDRFHALYEDVVALLNAQYFKHDTFVPDEQ